MQPHSVTTSTLIKTWEVVKSRQLCRVENCISSGPVPPQNRRPKLGFRIQALHARVGGAGVERDSQHFMRVYPHKSHPFHPTTYTTSISYIQACTYVYIYIYIYIYLYIHTYIQRKRERERERERERSPSVECLCMWMPTQCMKCVRVWGYRSCHTSSKQTCSRPHHQHN